MTEKLPVDFPSWEVADAAFERFVEVLPLRRVQLRERVAATGGPVLDGSLESVTPLAAWYFEVALADADDGMDWWPEWLPELGDRWRPNGHYWRGVSPQFVRLWALVGVYLGDVLIPLVPHARWVCWRAKAAREITAGAFAVDLGDALFPGNVFAVANANLSLWFMQYGTGGLYDRPLDPAKIERELRAVVDQRDSLRKDRPLTWQKAPTGPDAFRRTKRPDW